MNQKLAEFKQIMKNNETFRKMDDIAFKYDYIIKSAYLRRGKAEINIVRANEDYMPNVYYEKESFYNQHPTIRFTTEKEDAEYEIISVFKSRVYYKTEKNVFRYYYFINAETEEEYNQFVENVKRESLYNIDATANYGDQLITLSTCSYYVQDGRFAVVGRKIK